jgi:hypothetical protein
MQTLDDLVRDLLDRWVGEPTADREGDGGPGLLRRLDDLELRTAQPRGAGGRATPGSRPPGPLEAASWSGHIKREAIKLDMSLRRSTYPQLWEKALRAIPPNAQAAGRESEAAGTVGRWHSTCRTVLGLQPPAVEMQGVACLVCGQRRIRCRADRDKARAWCTNPECADEDGQPARYEGPRLHLLTANTVIPEEGRR